MHSLIPETIKAIVWDFDGVITKRGDNVKDDAWRSLGEELFPAEENPKSNFVEHLSLARAEYGQNKVLAGDRFDILASALKRTHGRDYTRDDPVVVAYADRYNSFVQELILADGVYPETRQALEVLVGRGTPLYVNTATPTAAVKTSLEALDLARYFKDALGFPGTKSNHLHAIIEREEVTPAEVLFIGDSSGDEYAAIEVGCQFVGVANVANGWKQEDKPYPLIERLTELLPMIK